MKRPRFYTSYAGHEHFAPIVNVTPDHLRKWWYEFAPLVGSYDVYLAGSLVQKMFGEYTGTVKDLDIILTGPVDDLDNLKDVLRQGVYLGFKRDIFCDIKYQSPIVTPWDTFEPFVVIKPGGTLLHMVNRKITQRNLINTEHVQLPNGLFQQHFTSPPRYHEKYEFKRKRHGYQPIIKKLNKNLEI